MLCPTCRCHFCCSRNFSGHSTSFAQGESDCFVRKGCPRWASCWPVVWASACATWSMDTAYPAEHSTSGSSLVWGWERAYVVKLVLGSGLFFEFPFALGIAVSFIFGLPNGWWSRSNSSWPLATGRLVPHGDLLGISFKVRARWFIRMLKESLKHQGSGCTYRFCRPHSRALALHTGCLALPWNLDRIAMIDAWLMRFFPAGLRRVSKCLESLPLASKDDRFERVWISSV